MTMVKDMNGLDNLLLLISSFLLPLKSLTNQGYHNHRYT